MIEAVNFRFAGIDFTLILKLAIYLRQIITSKVKKNITCFQSPPFDINKNYIMAATVCCIMPCSMGLDQVSTLFLNAQNRTSPDGTYLSFQ